MSTDTDDRQGAAAEAAPRASAETQSAAAPGAARDVGGSADSVPLSHEEWQFAGTQRAGLYGWFSRLYAEEVSEPLYRSHFADGGFAPFAGLAELSLEAEVQRLDAAIATLRAEQLPRLELAADFAQLFLLDGKTSALPYASAYAGTDSASPRPAIRNASGPMRAPRWPAPTSVGTPIRDTGGKVRLMDTSCGKQAHSLSRRR